MTEPTSTDDTSTDDTSTDNTRTEGALPTETDAGVRGGDADRLDSAGEGSGGLAGAGADGETGAREQLRQDLGERSAAQGTEGGGDLDGSS